MLQSILNAWKTDTLESIHVNELDALLGKIDLIDIREPYEYATGSLKTAKNIPMGQLLGAPDSYLQKDKTYYILCQSGMRSKQTSRALVKQGYRIINVTGGMGSYVGTQRTKV